MTKYLALAAAALAAPLAAQGIGGIVLTNPEFAGGFTNRGQCVSALAHVRNMQRANPALRGVDYRTLSPSAFNRESLRTTRCEMIGGRYRVVFYRNYFPR